MVSSVALLPLAAACRMPGVDDEMVGGIPDPREHDFGDLDAKPVRLVDAVGVGDFDGTPRYLGIARLGAGVRRRSVLRRAM